MIAYNELSRAADNEIKVDDYVVIVENLGRENKVVADKNVEVGVKIEVNIVGLEDCSINLEAD